MQIAVVKQMGASRFGIWETPEVPFSDGSYFGSSLFSWRNLRGWERTELKFHSNIIWVQKCLPDYYTNTSSLWALFLGYGIIVVGDTLVITRKFRVDKIVIYREYIVPATSQQSNKWPETGFMSQNALMSSLGLSPCRFCAGTDPETSTVN